MILIEEALSVQSSLYYLYYINTSLLIKSEAFRKTNYNFNTLISKLPITSQQTQYNIPINCN